VRVEDKKKQLNLSFQLLDIDGDNVLNILNLLYLQKNIPYNTRIGVELMEIIEYYLSSNVYSRSLRDRIEINFEVFITKQNSKLCLREEIRERFLGIGVKLDLDPDQPHPVPVNYMTPS